MITIKLNESMIYDSTAPIVNGQKIAVKPLAIQLMNRWLDGSLVPFHLNQTLPISLQITSFT